MNEPPLVDPPGSGPYDEPGEPEDSRLATRIIIMGAAGRDFHNFNTVFRDECTRST